MKYRKMGNLNWEVSVLGFGAMRLPTYEEENIKEIDEDHAIKMIRYAIDHGVNYIDTAWYYHNQTSENLVGKALQNGYREKVKLATKLPIQVVKSASDFNKYLDQQLEKLQTDYIDIYLFHALNAQQFKRLKDFDLILEMETAQKNGKIKHIGFSFHDNYDTFKKIVDYYDWDVCQIQYNYLDYNTQATTRGLEYAASKGIAVIIMEPIKGGSLVKDSHEIRELLEAYPVQRTMADWALQYVWNHPDVSVVLSGMSNLQQVKENITSAENSQPRSLSTADLDFLEVLGRRMKEKSLIPCTSCEYCLPCPSNVLIPQNFRLINDAFWDNDIETGQLDYAKLASTPDDLEQMDFKGSAALCIQCNQCLDKCPQFLNIPWLLTKIRKVFEDGKKPADIFQIQTRGPVLKTLKPFDVVGVQMPGDFHPSKSKAVWDAFSPRANEIKNSIPGYAYGITYGDSTGLHYLAGSEVMKVEDVPEKMKTLHFGSHQFAVFTHVGHISKIGRSMEYIQQDYFPNHPKIEINPKAPWIERYDNRFELDSEESELDLYIPIRMELPLPKGRGFVG